MTINSNIINRNNKYYIEFLTEDIKNNQTNIFLEKISQIRTKLSEHTNDSIIEIESGKISFLLNQHNLSIKTRFCVDNNYVDNFKDYLKNPNRASFILMFDNINNLFTVEILEMNIKGVETPKQQLILDESPEYLMKHRYDIIDQELKKLKIY